MRRRLVSLLLAHLLPATMQIGSITRSNSMLVDALVRQGLVSDSVVEAAMRSVDRADFCPGQATVAYDDRPLPIGFAATISAPHMHAYALTLLKDHLKPGARVLDVGVGSGYLAACMAEMVKPGGQVYGIDYIGDLVTLAKQNLARNHGEKLGTQIVLAQGDGWHGVPGASFDCIHVGAAAPQLPAALLEQLRAGGRMVIPVGTSQQELQVVDKRQDGSIDTHSVLPVRYVPLVHATARAGRDSAAGAAA